MHADRIRQRGDHLRWAVVVLLIVAIALLAAPGVRSAPSIVADASPALPASGPTCQGDHWVAAWTAAPQGSSLGRPDDAPAGTADGPERVFEDQTLRMVVSPRAAGSALRVRIGNRFGTAPLSLGAVTVGVIRSGATLVPGSVRAVTFGGSRTVAVDTLGVAVSDPLFVRVEPFERLAVSFHVAGAAPLDHHQWAQSTQYATPARSGDHADDESGAAFTEELTGWFGVAGVDVLAPRSVGAVVTLGDSITDGIGSSPGRDRRWPDRLARRLEAAGRGLSVVNAGIAGNHVVTSGLTSIAAIGPSARERAGRDALRLPGVTDVVVFEGINDINMATPGSAVATTVIDGLRSIIDQARAEDLRVIGATLTPASMTGAKEAARVAVNEWIRTSGEFDSVIDFDAVARDPGDPSRLRSRWDAGFAHLTDAGYDALARAVDIGAFRGTGC